MHPTDSTLAKAALNLLAEIAAHPPGTPGTRRGGNQAATFQRKRKHSQSRRLATFTEAVASRQYLALRTR